MKSIATHCLTVLALLAAVTAHAGSGLNWTESRPFYVIGHNPNTLDDATAAMAAGANALEPDIQNLHGCYGQTHELVVQHNDPCGISGLNDDTPTLPVYLSHVHDLAVQYPQQLALVMLDVKPEAVSPESGDEIIDAVRTYLNWGGVDVPVIISVADIDPDGPLFQHILSWNLGPREGIQIDDENNAIDVVNFFFGLGYTGNIAYGDGTAGPGGNLPRALDFGNFLRASIGFPKWTYVFTLNNTNVESAFIDGGANGIIPDHVPPPGYIQDGPILDLLDVVSNHPEIHLATRDDNPFQQPNQAYGIQVFTSDVEYAGTDADLTFELTGCLGSSSVTVNTGILGFNPLAYQSGRMERNRPDWVTLPSLDLGRLSSISIHNDGQSDWHLHDIHVSSAQWIEPDYNNLREYSATFDDWIKGGATQPIQLAAGFAEPLPTIQCPAPITVATTPKECDAIVPFSATASDVCPNVKAVSNPASGTTFQLGTTTVKSHAENPPSTASPECSFTVTVVDQEKPSITCPAPMVVNATGPKGAAAVFASPAVTDNCAVASVGCAPGSGSVFPIGTDTVGCNAKDSSGNQATCTFTIRVKGAAEQTADLIAFLKTLGIKPGVKGSLLTDLTAALAKLQSVSPIQACGPLQSFINDVNAQRGKGITVNDANALVAAATQIRAVDGCI